jgi:predicted NBD/HSP70 family sugar kinase
MDLSAVRRHHLSMALEHLLHNGPSSRADLARNLGVTKATTSALITDLLTRDLVEEQAAHPSGRVGRPGVDVAAAAWSVGALGLEVNVDYVSAAIIDLEGEIRVRYRRDGDNANARPSQVLRRLREVATRAMGESARSGIRCVGGALAVPGLVEPASRALFVAPNLHWLDVDLTHSALHLGIELGVDNEATLGALAELRYGAGRDLTSFVYVSGGFGVGGGIVIDGRVVRGANGFAGELGHVVVDPRGPRCACGSRGCLEVFVRGGANRGEAMARALATALRSVVHVADPQAVVLGGTLGTSCDLVERVAAHLREETLGGRWRPCEVRRSALGTDAAVVGAATTVLDAVVADPTLVPMRSERASA